MNVKLEKYWTFIRKYEILIASGAVILFVILLTINLLIPNLTTANQISDQKQIFKRKLDGLRQKDAMFSSLNYQNYKDLYLKINQVLPENKDYVSLFDTFDLLEKQSGATILHTNFELGIVSTQSGILKPDQKTGSYMVPVTVELSGNLDALQRFMNAVLDNYGRLLNFDDASYSNNNGILQVSFHGDAYYFPITGNLGAIDSALPPLTKNHEMLIKKINKLSIPADTSGEFDKGSIGKNNLFD